MKPTIKITPSDAPAVRHAQPGKWWHYEVMTASGQNQCSGYAPGARSDAERIAKGHLTHLESLEGSRAPKLVIIESQRVGKHHRHSSASPWRGWQETAHNPHAHDAECRCRPCSLKREKTRFFKTLNGTGDVKRRKRSRKRKACA